MYNIRIPFPYARIVLCPVKYLVHDLTLAVSKCKRTNKTCGKTKSILRQPRVSHDCQIRDTQSQVGNYIIYCISYFSNVNYFRELKYYKYKLNKKNFDLHTSYILTPKGHFREWRIVY